MEIINIGGQISSADFGQFSLGVYTENRMGKFQLVYSGDYSPLECLSLYRDRDSIEKAFRTLKTDLDIFPLRKQKDILEALEKISWW